MGKRSRTKARQAAPTEGAVGPRQPCPCGSGRRYKACHGAAGGPPPAYVARPFEGYAGECDLVALRELVPAATADVRLAGQDRTVRVCSMLPGASPALVRDSGDVWLGLQVQHNYGDPARDLGAALEKALAQAEAGETGPVGLTEAPGDGPRFQDLVENTPWEVTVHKGFDFWVDDLEDQGPAMAAALEQANAAAHPSARLGGVESAYWIDVGTKEHLRWVMPEPEDELLDALARLHVAGTDVIVEDARLVGMFRAYGLLVPVWDLAPGTGAAALEEPARQFAAALTDARSSGAADLTTDERAARSGLASRQVTIR